MSDNQNHNLSTNSDHNFVVVGIGASAGGLSALEELFANLPVDSGAAFVVIEHLSPDCKSLMKELLEYHGLSGATLKYIWGGPSATKRHSNLQAPVTKSFSYKVNNTTYHFTGGVSDVAVRGSGPLSDRFLLRI